jgi:hypothetical protein
MNLDHGRLWLAKDNTLVFGTGFYFEGLRLSNRNLASELVVSFPHINFNRTKLVSFALARPCFFLVAVELISSYHTFLRGCCTQSSIMSYHREKHAHAVEFGHLDPSVYMHDFITESTAQVQS